MHIYAALFSSHLSIRCFPLCSSVCSRFWCVWSTSYRVPWWPMRWRTTNGPRRVRWAIHVRDPIVHPPIGEDGRIVVLEDLQMRPVRKAVGEGSPCCPSWHTGPMMPTFGGSKDWSALTAVAHPAPKNSVSSLTRYKYSAPSSEAAAIIKLNAGPGLRSSFLKPEQCKPQCHAGGLQRRDESVRDPIAHLRLSRRRVEEGVASVEEDIEPVLEAARTRRAGSGRRLSGCSLLRQSECGDVGRPRRIDLLPSNNSTIATCGSSISISGGGGGGGGAGGGRRELRRTTIAIDRLTS